MNKNQLIESWSLRRSTMFLLGAGCSISSGCKSANLIIKDFKLRLYCDKHKIPYEKTTDYYEKELDKEINKEYPTPHGENPYSYYFEKCFPLPKDRNEYIRAEFQNKNPSLGYLCFANYLLQQQIHDVATTNFDRLVERAIRRLDPNADIVNESERSNPIGDHQISILSLHGDYNYDLTRNTESELQSLSKNVAEKFSEKHISRLIILGYSGQDKSVIDAIKMMENRCQNMEVIWCFFEVDPEIPTSIQQVLSYPQACAAFGINFDNLFIDYYRIKSPKNPVIDELIHRENVSCQMM